MDTLTQVERLIELAIIQRAELKRLVEELPQLREHLNGEIERTFEQAEPQIRAELEEFMLRQSQDQTQKLSEELTSKLEQLAKGLQESAQAKYSALVAERDANEVLLKQAEEKIAQVSLSLADKVKEIVSGELARFPRAGEIDQLRKEFAEPKSLNPRGKWVAGETYNKLDLVTINGDSYVSNIDGNTEKPSRSAGNWTLNAARGNSGGGGGITALNDLLGNPSAGDIVGSEGNNYVRKTLTAGTGITITDDPSTITIDASGAQEMLTATVKNAESVAITRGQVVYLFSATGGFPSVKLASNTSDATSAKTFGVVSDVSIAPNGTGTITCVGVVSNLNLGAYNDGDTVYLGATAGSITATKPYAPNHLVYVGIVERANAGNGELYVKIQNGYELDEIHDVQINSPLLAGQTLIYDATTDLWKNARLTAGVGVSISNGDSAITISADGGVNYQGTWNASTNTPTLTSSVGTKGFYYVVSVAGSTNLNGVTDWKVGDWAIFNGTAWEKVDTTDQVSSVFGRTGAVVGVSTDYSSVGITNTAIGATNPSTGAFTTLSATGNLTVSGGTGTFSGSSPTLSTDGLDRAFTFTSPGAGGTMSFLAGGVNWLGASAQAYVGVFIGGNTSVNQLTISQSNSLATLGSALGFKVTNTTASTSTTTGALVVTGGVGVGGNITANNIIAAKPAGGWAQLEAQAPAANTSAAVDFVPAGIVSYSNPTWFVGHRFSAQGPLSFWAYNGSGHENNALSLTTAGNATITGNLTVSGTGTSSVAGSFGVGGASPVVGFSGNEAAWVVGANRTDGGSGLYPILLTLNDTRAYNSTNPSPGGGLGFTYKYNAAGNYAAGVTIQGFKENTTDGNYAGAMRFLTRANGANPAEAARITSSGNFLLKSDGIDSSNGRLQLATHTTSAGGIGFGTVASLHADGNNGYLALTPPSGTTAGYRLYNSTTLRGQLAYSGTDVYLDASTGSLILRTGSSTTALTLDSSQNATFAGKVVTSSAIGATSADSLTTTIQAGQSSGVNSKILVRDSWNGSNNNNAFFAVQLGDGSTTSDALRIDYQKNATFAGTITSTGAFTNLRLRQSSGGTAYRWTLNNDTTLYLQYSADDFTSTVNNRFYLTSAGNATFAATTASTSTTTGALVVSGGLGVAGAINMGGSLTVATNNSLITLSHQGGASNKSTIESNAGVSGNYNGMRLASNWTGTAQGNSGFSSWFVDFGGYDGVTYGQDKFFIGRAPAGSTTISQLLQISNAGDATFAGYVTVDTTSGAAYRVKKSNNASGSQSWLSYLDASGTWAFQCANDNFVGGNTAFSFTRSGLTPTGMTINATTDSSSTTTGALTVGGGVGIAKAAYIGGVLSQGGASLSGTGAAGFKLGVGPQITVYSDQSAANSATGGANAPTYGGGKFAGWSAGGTRGVWAFSSDGNSYVTSGPSGAVVFGSFDVAPHTNVTATLTQYGYWSSSGVHGNGGAGLAIKGTTTNDSAAAGYVGEYVSGTLASGSATALTNSTAKTVTSISLTAGDWDVDGFVGYVPSAATVTVLYGGASTTNNTLGGEATYFQTPTSYSGLSTSIQTVFPSQRVSISSTITVYLIARADFSSGTMSAFGQIKARRVR